MISVTNIFLILISGLGVLHGFLISIYFLFINKGSTLSNRLLSLLLFVLSFRIGKSIILEYAAGVHLNLIFTGLAFLLLIGPLFDFYTKSILHKSFSFKRAFLLHFIPFLPALSFAFLINSTLIKQIPIWVFITMFCLYYGHYLFYLCKVYLYLKRAKQTQGRTGKIDWLFILLYALAAIWIVYVLNLIEDKVPYLIGPILYSLIAYGVTFIAIKKGYINQITHQKYTTTLVGEDEINRIFMKLKKFMEEDQVYKDVNLNLGMLSQQLNISTQKLSMIINVKFKANFSNFINDYRIRHSCTRFREKEFQNYTIAFIAFESGFSSVSSFNAAFKKVMGQTPSTYRKMSEQTGSPSFQSLQP
jgi:AraC-like DNA-binding protein